MQNALAVGETQEIRKNAELTTIKLRVSSNLHLSRLHIHNKQNNIVAQKGVCSKSEAKGLLQKAVRPITMGPHFWQVYQILYSHKHSTSQSLS